MVSQQTDTPSTIVGQVGREATRTVERTRRSIDVLLGRQDPEVGLTPKDTIYKKGTMKLYRFRPQTDDVYRVPIVFVMSLVSKYYILDLAPGQSFVEYLLKQGFDVYMIDWGYPRAEDHTLRLDDYVLDMMPRCFEVVRKTTGEDDLTVLGYCMGGDFGLMYAGAFPEDPVKNLICVAAPVDFEGMGLLKQWSDQQWFDVDRLVDTYGNIPAELILRSLEMLRPLERPLSYLRLWDNLWDEQYVYNWRIRYKWAQDQIPFPGEAYRQFTKELMWGNKLIKGELKLGDRTVDLKRIKSAVLNAIAEFDHISPYESTKPLLDAVGSEDKQELHVRGGHVSLIAGASAIMRMWPTVNEWLGVRSV
jgi:polyhydroxyalkanoate synthase